ncbi:MAG TPA: hypothetical protein DCY42_02740 [Chloroflexi bacterium]|nr:hypothetical protein [Chloroflexota bacterium]
MCKQHAPAKKLDFLLYMRNRVLMPSVGQKFFPPRPPGGHSSAYPAGNHIPAGRRFKVESSA